MFLKTYEELVNVNDIKTISIEEGSISDEKSAVLFVVAKTKHDKYLLGNFNSYNEATDLIDRIAEELEESGLLIDV